jgi:hypothetical protein
MLCEKSQRCLGSTELAQARSAWNQINVSKARRLSDTDEILFVRKSTTPPNGSGESLVDEVQNLGE